MTKEEQIEFFLSVAKTWICDDYSLDVRYIAGGKNNKNVLWDATIHIAPLPRKDDNSMKLNSENFSVGQIQKMSLSKRSLMAFLRQAVEGKISIQRKSLHLVGETGFDYYSDVYKRNSWYANAHLQVIGSIRAAPSVFDLIAFDDFLRRSEPSFDGFDDLGIWLGLSVPGANHQPPTITISIAPPIAIDLDASKLVANHLSLVLTAHEGLNVSNMTLSIRTVPGTGGLNGRRLLNEEIAWNKGEEKTRTGRVEVALQAADSVLVMITIGENTVQRQWILDQSKARNTRFLAMQHFDKDLKMMKRYLLESANGKESARFEESVAALLFLMGFTAALPLETDAPDLIVTTPSGRIVLIECTVKVADVNTKVGKLVDRRESLARTLESSGHQTKVIAILVCGMSSQNMALGTIDLRALNIVAITKEDLKSAVEQLWFPGDPDQLLDKALLSSMK